MANSLYIHIPFCRKKCLYCDFYSFPCNYDIVIAYINTLIKQIEQIDNKFLTIYIGGGTPSLLSLALIKKLLSSLQKNIQNNTEFTIEVNPDSLTREKSNLFLDYKVNRLSIGVQSFNNETLKKLGRIHNAEKSIDAIRIAANAGFKNINIDLIFGIWGQCINDWNRELSLAVKLPIKHISCYALSYEKKTGLYRKVQSKNITPLDSALVAEMFEYTIEYLPTKGFLHYEVSNFSKKEYECRHNFNYWQNNDYIGLGESAVSYINGERIKNIGEKISRERLSIEKRAKETAALKIRTKEGINFTWFKQKTGFDVKEFIKDSLDNLLANNLVKLDARNIKLTKKGFLFADTISSSFL
ncbi:MAG: radical SAM family heme chaperone HemW [Candidatus Omnitrophota bacterium]